MRGYQFPYILCKKFVNEANASDILLNFCKISDSCQTKTQYLPLEEVSDSRKRYLFEPDLSV